MPTNRSLIIVITITVLFATLYFGNTYLRNTANRKYLFLVKNRNLIETFLSDDQTAMETMAKQYNLSYKTLDSMPSNFSVVWIKQKTEERVLAESPFETLPKILPKLMVVNRQFHIAFPVVNEITEKGVVIFSKI